MLICTASEADDLEGKHRVAVLEKPWSLDQFMAKLQELLKAEEPNPRKGPGSPGAVV